MATTDTNPPTSLGTWVFAVLLLVYALGMPLGLGRISGAPLLAAGLALGGDGSGHEAPLPVLLTRLMACVPLGDVATRANLGSALCGALAAVALLRLVLEVATGIRPPVPARATAVAFAHEPLAAIGAAGVSALGLCVFVVMTSGSGVAPEIVAILYGWIGCIRLARRSDDAASGLGALFACGLAATGGGGLFLLSAPPTLLLWFWAFRRGERWPLLGPLALVLPLGLWLLPAFGGGPFGIRDLVDRWLSAGGASPSPWGLSAALGEVGDQIGVIAGLLAVVGAVTLIIRMPFAGVLIVGTGFVALMVAARGTASATEGGFFVLSLMAASIAAGIGIVTLCTRMGAARTPAAAVLAVTAVISPILDGGGARWVRDTRLASSLVDTALGRVPLRGRVTPGSPELTGLLDLARVVGLRPDLNRR